MSKTLNLFQKDLVGFAVKTNRGVILIDEDGEWSWGGAGKTVGIIAFAYKNEAQRFAKKIRRQRPHFIEWTQVIRIFETEAIVLEN